MTTFVLRLKPNAIGRKNGKRSLTFYYDNDDISITTSFVGVMNRSKCELRKQAGKYIGSDWRKYYKTTLEVRY